MAKKRQNRAPKRIKVQREAGVHYVYKDSGTKAPTVAVWTEHFFHTHRIVLEQDGDDRFRVPQREVLHVKQASRKAKKKKKNGEKKV